MASVFAAFLVDTDPVIKSIGLSLTIGVLTDAFVVRMTLVPAVLALPQATERGGSRSRLERIVPDVDIEGESLVKGAPAS